MNSRILPIIAACALGLSFIFYVIGNALPSWSKTSGGSYTIGLWKICARAASTTICARFICLGSLGDVCGKIDGARAFMTLACIFSIVALILLILRIFAKKFITHLLFIIMKILPFVCLVMGIIAVALSGNATASFLKTTHGGNIRFGPAAIIGIVALLINLLGAVISLLIKMEN